MRVWGGGGQREVCGKEGGRGRGLWRGEWALPFRPFLPLTLQTALAR